MKEIKKTFEIYTNISPTVCPVCRQSLDRVGFSGDKIDAAINHILDHGWRLLHIGSEWGRDSEGKSVHHTVVFLGAP